MIVIVVVVIASAGGRAAFQVIVSRQVDFAEGKEAYESREGVPGKQDHAGSAIKEQSDEQNRDEASEYIDVEGLAAALFD